MLELFMDSGGCAGSLGASVTYCILKKNYSIIAKEMLPRQRTILVETFDKDGNIIDTKLESGIETEKIKSTEIKKLLKEHVDCLDFRLENILSDSTLKLIPSLPNMRRYWLELDGFVRGKKKYETVDPPAKICFIISKSLVEICIGEIPDKTFFNELKQTLEACSDTPKHGQVIKTTFKHGCVLMSNTYFTKPFMKECEKTVQEISQLTEKALKKFPKLYVGNYSQDLPKKYYRYPPGIYEDEAANTSEPKDRSYNVSFLFGFWQAWFEIIITFEKLPEDELMNSFTVFIRDELFDLFNSSKD